MTTRTKSITAAELLAMPRGDGKRYELIRGVLIETMPAGDPHGDAVVQTTFALELCSRTNDYGVTRTGEPGYRLERGPDTVRTPDVAWIASGRIPAGTVGFPELAPDLAVEVKSPSNSRNGRQGGDVAQLRFATIVGTRPGAHCRHGLPPKR